MFGAHASRWSASAAVSFAVDLWRYENGPPWNFLRRWESDYHGTTPLKIEAESEMKTAIVIMSDPRAGEEALGRLFNGLAVADEALKAGDHVAIVFNGAGTRWPGELAQPQHPAHALYHAVREAVHGASCGCAAVFGATQSVEAAGLPLLKDKALPGTPGILNLHRYLTDGWHTLVF